MNVLQLRERLKKVRTERAKSAKEREERKPLPDALKVEINTLITKHKDAGVSMFTAEDGKTIYITMDS